MFQFISVTTSEAREREREINKARELYIFKVICDNIQTLKEFACCVPVEVPLHVNDL